MGDERRSRQKRCDQKSGSTINHENKYSFCQRSSTSAGYKGCMVKESAWIFPRLIQRNTSGLQVLAALGEAVGFGCPGFAGAFIDALKALGYAKNPHFVKRKDEGFSAKQACHSRDVPAIEGHLNTTLWVNTN